ncbi:HAD family phosphatase [Guyparkeria sp. 1SP6A2]|nr:HAD family phosphatase [Guyparkeria sp. 1SP6A2]
MIRCVLFDFGGVIAEEGFRRALKAAARRHGLDPEELPRQAMDAVYESGFVVGRGGEADFWRVLQEKMPFPETFETFRDEVMRGFVVRPEMLELVDELSASGKTVAILSDQTHWLDELDRRDGIYRHFDRVFNSYYLGKGKRDISLFRDVLEELGCRPSEALFVDDSEDHVMCARSEGLHAIHCERPASCIAAVRDAVKGE